MYRNIYGSSSLSNWWSNPYMYSYGPRSYESSSSYGSRYPGSYFCFGRNCYGRDGRSILRRFNETSYRSPLTVRTDEERNEIEGGTEEVENEEDEPEIPSINDVTPPASDVTPDPPVPVVKPPKRIAGVDDINLHIGDNHRDHNGAHLYAENIRGLFLRRGQTFKITVKLKRKFRSDFDKVIVLLATGKAPLITDDTLVKIEASEDNLTPTEWAYRFTSPPDGQKSLELEIMIAADAIIGKHVLFIETFMKDSVEIRRRRSIENVYILFNPWCKDDMVYMEGEQDREEYVLNDKGVIWQSDPYRGKKWNFGQFEKDCFEAALYLLDNSSVKKIYHANPIMVTRAFSAMVNSNDREGGVLMGNWSGNYDNGTSPLQWSGSVAILKEYMKENKPVKYGQCWVFSGVLTTVCRSVGIPTRSVTNFDSAHDSGDNLTIDYFYDEDGNRDYTYTNDSTWNFHVWNDAWMTRPDLKPGYDGWQAIDSTPQEASEERMRCGPSPLIAIKNGDVSVSYDTKFIFSEVNGDVFKWKVHNNGTLSLIDLVTDDVGTLLLTKDKMNDNREIVTLQYKYKEGSSEAKAAMKNAFNHMRSSNRARTKKKKVPTATLR